jgi:hypothetical protein
MQDYKLFFLDRNDVIITTRDFGGADDAAASVEGEKFRSTHTIEICCGNRRVARLDRRPAPKAELRPAATGG